MFLVFIIECSLLPGAGHSAYWVPTDLSMLECFSVKSKTWHQISGVLSMCFKSNGLIDDFQVLGSGHCIYWVPIYLSMLECFSVKSETWHQISVETSMCFKFYGLIFNFQVLGSGHTALLTECTQICQCYNYSHSRLTSKTKFQVNQACFLMLRDQWWFSSARSWKLCLSSAHSLLLGSGHCAY